MSGLTGGNRGLWRAGALAVAAAVAVLTTGCGLVHVHFGSSGGPAPPGGGTMPATASPPGGAVSADCLTTQPPCYTPQQLEAGS